MTGYYAEHLAADRLQRCYELAPPRVRQYLDAEIEHVISHVRPTDAVLELGCGYGRVLARLAPHAARVVGIDTASASLELARQYLREFPNCELQQMDAAALDLAADTFDVVVCIQNGVSAFGIDRRTLIAEAIRVTRPGGRILLSSYAAEFWPDRLEWFRLQSEQGLLGEIDWSATGDGVIVCRDGFRATTVTPEEFLTLSADFGTHRHVQTIDESSVFCEINK